MNPLQTTYLREQAERVRERLGNPTPTVAAVLGSGWGAALDDWRIEQTLAYESIPVLGSSAVKGHAGKLHLADADSHTCLIFQGRRHWYGCTAWDPIIFPVYLAHCLGVRTILLTNAAGGIRDDLDPGDLMVIDDHINAMGANPLRGPHQPDWGPRFPDLTRLYTPALQGQLMHAAATVDVVLKQGTYLAVSGPSYETPAEVRAYATMGAAAVGMSTVPEAIVAGALGMRVAGLSCITNRAAATGNEALSHDEVIAITAAATPRMRAVVGAFIRDLDTPAREEK
ncbi:MAG: purine-nucleoside phosphorylase [Lentisphaerae bacterium]|nr:purine-nucleoside phosphorylase [Lentisphaerota bacterium]